MCSLYPTLMRDTPRPQRASGSLLWLESSSVDDLQKTVANLAAQPALHRAEKQIKIFASHPPTHGGLIRQLPWHCSDAPAFALTSPAHRPIVKRCPQMHSNDQRGRMPVTRIGLKLPLHIANRLR